MRKKEYFNISCVHRDDLIQAGFDGRSVDDETMERLARKMEEDYVEQLFWSHLAIIAEELGINKLDASHDE